MVEALSERYSRDILRDAVNRIPWLIHDHCHTKLDAYRQNPSQYTLLLHHTLHRGRLVAF